MRTYSGSFSDLPVFSYNLDRCFATCPHCIASFSLLHIVSFSTPTHFRGSEFTYHNSVSGKQINGMMFMNVREGRSEV